MLTVLDVLPDAFVVSTLLIKPGDTIKKVDPSLRGYFFVKSLSLLFFKNCS